MSIPKTLFLRVVVLSILTVGTNCFLLTSSALWCPLLLCFLIGLWMVNPNSIYIQLPVTFLLTLLFLQYNYHASNSSPAYWVLRPLSLRTYAGTSSCTNNALAKLPYNPNSRLGYTDVFDVHTPLAYCPLPGFRWADATNEPFTGTDLEYVFETTPRKCSVCMTPSRTTQDYEANLGRGLTFGLTQDSSITDTTLCPRLSRTITTQRAVGEGLPICTTCTSRFSSSYPECLSHGRDLFCFLCPGWNRAESTSSAALKSLAAWCFFWTLVVASYSVLVLFGSTCTFLWGVKRKL